MKYFLNLLICLLTCTVSNAQIETTNWLYKLTSEMPKELEFNTQEPIKILKVLNDNRYVYPDALLEKTLNSMISQGELTIYKDKEFQNPYPKETVEKLLLDLQTDTFRIFDPEVFDETTMVIRASSGFFSLTKTVCEIEQKWKYNSGSKQLNMDLEAIHVYFLERNYDGKFKHVEAKKYLFSIKNNGKRVVNGATELKKTNITWAAEFTYTDVFKNEALRKELLSKTHLKAHKIVSTADRKTILTNHEIEEISTGFLLDTIITYDPNTFEEKININSRRLYYGENHIKTFRVVQDFYFDTKTNNFNTRIIAIAPVRKIYDDKGNFEYQYPMFWIVYDDDFLKTFD